MLHLFLGRKERGRSIVLSLPPLPSLVHRSKDTTPKLWKLGRFVSPIPAAEKPSMQQQCIFTLRDFPIQSSEETFSPALLPSPTPPPSLLLLRGKPRRRRSPVPTRLILLLLLQDDVRRRRRLGEPGNSGGVYLDVISRGRRREEHKREGRGGRDRNRPSFVHTQSVCRRRRPPPPSRFKATAPWER